MNEIRIPYKIRTSDLFKGITVTVFSVIFMGYEIFHNGIAPENATIFFWIPAAFLTVISGVVFYLSMKVAFSSREIVITGTSIIVPKNFITEIDEKVDFPDMTALTIITIKGIRLLKIKHSRGELRILESMLPEAKNLEEIISQIPARIDLAINREA